VNAGFPPTQGARGSQQMQGFRSAKKRKGANECRLSTWIEGRGISWTKDHKKEGTRKQGFLQILGREPNGYIGICSSVHCRCNIILSDDVH
jgi:hypothetical protein